MAPCPLQDARPARLRPASLGQPDLRRASGQDAPLGQGRGYKVHVGGPRDVGEHIKKVYSSRGRRAFDVDFMATVYERPFQVRITEPGKVPASKRTVALGRHLDGCRTPSEEVRRG